MQNGIPYANTLNLCGDIVCTLGQTNQTEQETQYDAYGNIIDGSTTTSFGYTGEYMDSETELYYLSARFYDPELGRFTQEDDWLTEGPNLYIYCKNNPVLFSDPSGHCNANDLVYYRKKGDIATLEKLKRLIANGGCVPQYHHDPNETNIQYSIEQQIGAIYVVDFSQYGLSIVGHSYVYLKDINGKWIKTEYNTPEAGNLIKMKKNSQIYVDNPITFKQVEDILKKGLRTLYMSGSFLSNSYTDGLLYYFIEGEFSDSIKLANKYKGSNYNGYLLVSNNCLDYVREILSAGIICDNQIIKVLKKSKAISPYAFYVDLLNKNKF